MDSEAMEVRDCVRTRCSARVGETEGDLACEMREFGRFVDCAVSRLGVFARLADFDVGAVSFEDEEEVAP